jgi:two-component system, NarL family, response regulator DevR
MRILALVSLGRTNKEIAEEIFLSEKTVRNYVSSIFTKLNFSTRAEAAAYAVRFKIEDHLSME